MSLILGGLLGLCYGLSAFAGAFVSIPLLVLGVGLNFHQSLPVALFAIGIVAAVAAGDAVRARQCDTRRAGVLGCGALPVAIVASWFVHGLSEPVLATLFMIVSVAASSVLLVTSRRPHDRLAPPPAALIDAPRRPLSAAAQTTPMSGAQRGRLVATGAGCGLLVACCAAPGHWFGWHSLDRQLAGEAHRVTGTLVFFVAVLAVLASGVQFFRVGELPGYAAGLFVLGAVSGMGVARRVHHLEILCRRHTVIGGAVLAGSLLLWIVLIKDVT